MAKTVYKNKEDIPEGLEDFFVERDGTFRYDADDYETKDEVKNLKSALRKERDSVSELEDKVKAIPDDFDAEKWDSLKHVDPEDVNAGGDEKYLKQIDNLKEQISGLKEAVNEKESALEQQGSKYKTTLQRADIKSALASAGVTDEVYLETATDRVLRNQRIDSVEDNGTYKTVVGDMDKSPQEWAKDWVDTEEGKRFAIAPENTGGGSRNNGKAATGFPKAKNGFSDKQ